MEETMSLTVISRALEEETNVKIYILGATIIGPKFTWNYKWRLRWLGGYVATFSGVTSYISGLQVFSFSLNLFFPIVHSIVNIFSFLPNLSGPYPSFDQQLHCPNCKLNL